MNEEQRNVLYEWLNTVYAFSPTFDYDEVAVQDARLPYLGWYFRQNKENDHGNG